MLVKCLQQRIINILIRTYNISPSDAYDIWSRAVATPDKRVEDIINAIIKSEPEGLPVIKHFSWDSNVYGQQACESLY